MKLVLSILFCALTLPLCAQAPGSAVPVTAASSHVTDISRVIVDETMARLPTPADLGEWGYAPTLFLLGDMNVYRRTHDPKYLAYAKSWMDSHIDAKGNVDVNVQSLDWIMPGNLAVVLYQQTGDVRYKLAADKLAAHFATYPRISDGGFWHMTDDDHAHQLWLDGTYMALPFMMRQASISGNQDKAAAEAVSQLIIYGNHLRDAHGPLYFHAYDESGKQAWANPGTHQSPEKWARSIGWYCMALVDVLDALPKSPASPKLREQRKQLITIVQHMASDLRSLQDPTTGLWFQIIDKPALPGNFRETSSSSMFTYFLDIAVKRGYIDPSYHAAVMQGYHGVLSNIVMGADGKFHILDISEGTDVGDQAYYLARQRHPDDYHGLGAFLLMNEEVQFNHAAMQVKRPVH